MRGIEHDQVAESRAEASCQMQPNHGAVGSTDTRLHMPDLQVIEQRRDCLGLIVGIDGMVQPTIGADPVDAEQPTLAWIQSASAPDLLRPPALGSVDGIRGKLTMRRNSAKHDAYRSLFATNHLPAQDRVDRVTVAQVQTQRERATLYRQRCIVAGRKRRMVAAKFNGRTILQRCEGHGELLAKVAHQTPCVSVNQSNAAVKDNNSTHLPVDLRHRRTWHLVQRLARRHWLPRHQRAYPSAGLDGLLQASCRSRRD